MKLFEKKKKRYEDTYLKLFDNGKKSFMVIK